MKEVIESLKNKGTNVSLGDVDIVTKAFLLDVSDKLSFFCHKAYGDVNEVSLGAFRATASEEIKNAIITFVNSGHSLDGLKPYLLTSLRTIATRLANDNKKTVFICPGCRYIDRYTVLEYRDKYFLCSNCQNDLVSGEDQEKIILYQAFANHSKKGYRCPDCERFIPNPTEEPAIISCPFPDCFFSGKLSELESMRHPTVKGSAEIAIIDGNSSLVGGNSSGSSELPMQNRLSDNLSGHMLTYGDRPTLIFNDSSTSTSMMVEQKIKEHYEILMKTIQDQRGSLSYNSNDSTLRHKVLMYDAYINIIAKYPQEMISYLVHENRNGGLQHKIFQEYVRLLEASLPHTYIKNGKRYDITSLLDKNLCIFSGESTFDAEVTSEHEIDNKTEELYVGGRKGFYCRRYYIGKLLEVTDLATQRNLLPFVKEYTFFKVCLEKSIPTGTAVRVRHLRIPPHYQMGGMVYLNRIRRKIVDRIHFVINGKKREPKR